MTKAVLSLGSNQGHRIKNLEIAFENIGKISQTEILAKSQIFETDPIGGPEQESYLNAVVLIETDLVPQILLAALQDIENIAGRTRETIWGPRTLDIDIIDVEGFVSDSETLQVPHPRAKERRFVLQPMAEVSPQWLISGTSVLELLAQVTDQNVREWKD
jgi:2-amino-4-hydroxy-6-hydroxymethyldihydropteridine diphosphokinase